MGITYQLVRLDNKTIFELGKGSWPWVLAQRVATKTDDLGRGWETSADRREDRERFTLEGLPRLSRRIRLEVRFATGRRNEVYADFVTMRLLRWAGGMSVYLVAEHDNYSEALSNYRVTASRYPRRFERLAHGWPSSPAGRRA